MIYLQNNLKWLILIMIISAFVGSASALFLWSLDLATTIREHNEWIIYFLPVAGLSIGLLYHYYGKNVSKGNNLIIEEFHEPKATIPLRMSLLVYIGTIVSHLFGASVGREGTAVQMGVSIADQFKDLFKLKNEDRKTLIVVGISAGFASVFGTPLAASIFAIELFHVGKFQIKYIVQSLLAAYIAHYACLIWGIHHSQYSIDLIPTLNITTIFLSIIAGIIYGLAAFVFSKSVHLFTDLSKKINYAPLRPFIGGLVIASVYFFFDLNKFMGLGLDSISASFNSSMNKYDFIIKLFLTTFTIGFGFKGGEVTPLFFIGATLGNILIWFVPLPFALLAGMGFVAVFASATKTPIACIIMGAELFGIDSVFYIMIACVIAFLCSGKKGIYSSQLSN